MYAFRRVNGSSLLAHTSRVLKRESLLSQACFTNSVFPSSTPCRFQHYTSFKEVKGEEAGVDDVPGKKPELGADADDLPKGKRPLGGPSGSGSGGGSNGRKQTKKNSDSNDPEPPESNSFFKASVLFAGTAGLLLFWSSMSNDVATGNSHEITFQDFKRDFLETRRVEKLVIKNRDHAFVYLKENGNRASHYFVVGSMDTLERQLEDAQIQMRIPAREFIAVQHINSASWVDEALRWATILPIPLLILFMMSKMGPASGGGGMGGAGNIFSIRKSGAKLIKPDDSKAMFKDVAGLDEAKVEVMEFVQFLKDPGRFTKLGAKIPKGALLVGPPGTGKTLLAKAVAGEASVPFYSISGSDFIEMFVGIGPSRVRDLFATARKAAPCIIFIDEIDAVGRARGKGGFSGGGNDERENTLNQLLVEMDGFSPSEGVVVLAGTNRADILDKALLRPGRFDRQIAIEKPDIKGRQQIFMVHLKGIKLKDAPEFISRRLAALTPGFAGADIANICNEAALIAARSDKDHVEFIDFEKAVDRVIGGIERPNSLMNKKEREIVAYHESGHAVAGWFLQHSDPLLKVTIVPRGGGSLGFAQYLPKELSLYQSDQLKDMICMALGGRASEQLFFGRISTGASDDLKKVTHIAYGHVSYYGMNEKLGNVSYQPSEGDSQFTKPYSERTGQLIDEEVTALINKCYERILALLGEKKELIEKLAKQLLATETISHNDLVDILGPRPYGSPAYDAYVKEAAKIEPKDEAPTTIDTSCQSVHSDKYQCTVSKVVVSNKHVILHFSWVGDSSEGPLQSPDSSRLSTGESSVTPILVDLTVDTAAEKRGTMKFALTSVVPGTVYYFEAGKSGYSKVQCFVMPEIKL